MDMPQVIEIGNGAPAAGTFSDAEMSARLARLRARMAGAGIDCALFTSHHNVCYYADFLYCQFGRPFALVVDAERSTTVSPKIDGGQPGRRTFGGRNLVYTDWQRDNFLRALQRLIGDGARIGIERDHVTLLAMERLQAAFPASRFVDVAETAMRLRMVKSAEEIALIAEMARIADLGGVACVEALAPGVGEHEVALHATETMVREIARCWPQAELRDTWTWFQSGINTDGAHNPLTGRRIAPGDILSLNCFPMVAGYYAALERTLFCERAAEAALRLWEINCQVHEAGKALLKPGARCCEVARALNEIYAAHGLLQYRTFGYGHSFGVLCHYYGREAGLELREDVDTVLVPDMVVSMEPMIVLPEGGPGAGGYREHDILAITEDGNRNLTGFPIGPEHNIVRA